MKNICARKDSAPDGTVFVGIGVIPDIEIKDTRESFLANKDFVLEEAIKLKKLGINDWSKTFLLVLTE